MKKKVLLLAFLLFTVVHIILDIWWMAFGGILILAILLFVFSKNKFLADFRQRWYLIYPFSLIGIFLLGISLRVLIFGFYIVPTGSMERTIYPGDVIWVNKTLIGPKLPSSIQEIPWIGAFYWIANYNKGYMPGKWFDYYRLKGYSPIKHNQILVFEHPYFDLTLVKRCIGCPGDTIQINQSKVTINNQYISESSTLLIPSEDSYEGVSELSPKEIFPHHPKSIWTASNFGPLIIPYKGMTITLNEKNFQLYREVIKNLDKNEVIKSDSGDFILNGSPIKEYTFCNNYFFMMGDNRAHSHDSRFFGPVPEYEIIGRATTVLFNTSPYHKWYGRIFKQL